jgi:cobalamin biosynthesis protein CobT
MEFRGVGTKREFDKRAGVIDRESLHKVAVGNPRVFTTDMPHAVPDADATLLVDMSGSMLCGVGRSGYSRIYIASQAAYAFSTVLDLIGVPNEVLGFTTSVTFDHRTAILGHYSRVRPLHQLVVKPAASTARAHKARFAAMAHYDQCAENIDGECVMWAAQRLAARNRRGMAPILIVLSDGEPASVPERHSVLNLHLSKTVERIEKAGINVIGVGIQTKSVQRFYKNNLVIGDVKDLVGTSYGILRSVLRKAKRAV